MLAGRQRSFFIKPGWPVRGVDCVLPVQEVLVSPASVVGLAQVSRLPLATLDKALYTAARASDVEVVKLQTQSTTCPTHAH